MSISIRETIIALQNRKNVIADDYTDRGIEDLGTHIEARKEIFEILASGFHIDVDELMYAAQHMAALSMHALDARADHLEKEDISDTERGDIMREMTGRSLISLWIDGVLIGHMRSQLMQADLSEHDAEILDKLLTNGGDSDNRG